MLDGYDQSACGFCENFTFSDEFPTTGLCSREGARYLIDPTCFWFKVSTRNKFLYHWFFEWDENFMYLTSDFTDVFGISRHLSRHYLLNILTYNEAKVFRIIISNTGYYMKRTNFDVEQMSRYAKYKLVKMTT